MLPVQNGQIHCCLQRRLKKCSATETVFYLKWTDNRIIVKLVEVSPYILQIEHTAKRYDKISSFTLFKSGSHICVPFPQLKNLIFIRDV